VIPQVRSEQESILGDTANIWGVIGINERIGDNALCDYDLA
jgi:hypothetical protein